MSTRHGLIKIYLGQYPIWVQQLLIGRWYLYMRMQEQEEIMGVGSKGLVKENIKTKRYYLGTYKGIQALTPGNFKAVLLDIIPDDPKLYDSLDHLGFEYDKLPELVQKCNEWSQQEQYTSK